MQLFAGIGGICLGFKQAGFDIAWANEYDAAACKTYRRNFGDSYLVEDDIRNVKADGIPDFEMLAASFPVSHFPLPVSNKAFKINAAICFLR